MKKILFISASFGSGHTQAAEALLEETKLSTQIQAIHIDVLSFLPNFLQKPLRSSYLFITQHTPMLWKSVYHLMNQAPIYTPFRVCITKSASILIPRFFKHVKRFHPDEIVCTHPFPAQLLQRYSNKQNVPLSIVVTDYDLHTFWLTPHVTTYFVSTQKIKKQLEKHNIKNTKIIISGIPIQPNIYKPQNESSLRNSLNIPANNRIILITMGGSAHHALPQIVKTVCNSKDLHHISVIAVAGKNKTVLEKLKQLAEEKPKHQLISLGWTDKIPNYMKLANIVIGKPGGVTLSEAIATDTPFISIYPTPGQEDANASYLQESSKGYALTSIHDLSTTIANILQNPHKKLPDKNKRASKIILDSLIKKKR